MGTPPKKAGLTLEDLPGAPSWFGKALETLNPFMLATSAALGKALTFGDNFLGELRDVPFTAPAPVWTAPTLGHSWVNEDGYAPASYRIDAGGRVHLRGLMKNGSLATTAFALPAGYRPTLTEAFAAEAHDGANPVHGLLFILSTGEVQPTYGGNTHFSLSGISFDAASPAALPAAPSGWVAVVRHTLPTVVGVVPVGCRVEGAQSSQSSGLPVVDWELDKDGAVRVKAAHGLSAGQKYAMRLLLIAG